MAFSGSVSLVDSSIYAYEEGRVKITVGNSGSNIDLDAIYLTCADPTLILGEVNLQKGINSGISGNANPAAAVSGSLVEYFATVRSVKPSFSGIDSTAYTIGAYIQASDGSDVVEYSGSYTNIILNTSASFVTASTAALTVVPQNITGVIVASPKSFWTQNVDARPQEYSNYDLQYTAIAYTDLARQIDVTPLCNWTSSNSSVATMEVTQIMPTSSASGKLVKSVGAATVVANGSTTLSAGLVFNGTTLSGSAALTVQNPQSVKLQIVPSVLNVFSGSTGELKAYVTDQAGSQIDATSIATWTSSNTGVATVSAGTVTHAQNQAAGEVEIKASVSGSVFGTARVSIITR